MVVVIQALLPHDVAEKTVASLGFTPNDALTDTPVLAALLRRIASFQAPCSFRRLIECAIAQVDGIHGLEPDRIEGKLENVLDAVLEYGDLHERASRDGTGEAVYLAQPGFVVRPNGTVFLVGTPPDGRPILPDSLATRIRCSGHTRRIDALPNEDLPEAIRSFGLVQIPEKLWFRQPKSQSAEAVVSDATASLNLAKSSGDVVGLQVLDTARPVRFYRGRWVPPEGLSGHLIGRRPQLYGAPVWCFVALSGGRVERLSDIVSDEWRACDHAWRLQLAIDYLAGSPQIFQIKTTPSGQKRIDFFSPIPSWIRKRWDIIASPAQEKGSLFSYVFLANDLAAERQILTEQLWMQELSD